MLLLNNIFIFLMYKPLNYNEKNAANSLVRIASSKLIYCSYICIV